MFSEWIVSEDGFHWQRPYRAAAMKYWSYADPVLIGGKMHFAVWEDGGMKTIQYGENRCFAVCAGSTAGSFLTRPLPEFEGALAVNADATHGWIEFALADETGAAIPNSAALRIENEDGAGVPLHFSAANVTGQAVRLQVKMQNAKLFALEIPK